MMYVILIISIIFFICGILFYKKKNDIVRYQNNILQQQKNRLQSSIQSNSQRIQEQQKYIKNKEKQIDQLRKKADQFYNKEKDIIKNRLEDFKQITKESANSYVAKIQEVYEHAAAAHAEKMTRLKEEQDGAAASLKNLKETRKAAYEAILKEKEIKENKDNYRLLPTPQDLDDIHTLERVKQGLHKPRILSMLIWQTFWQPIAKKQFPVILQNKTKMGIYKITNLETDESYIGQSVDIYKRFCQHCKAGLGIDTPVGNKLYKAIQEYGLQNFTFELLCECSKQELDGKESYFIELYQADTFGYNGTKGNK